MSQPALLEDEDKTQKARILIQHGRFRFMAASVKEFSEKVLDGTAEQSQLSLAQLSKHIMVLQSWFAKQEAIKAACLIDQQDSHSQRQYQEKAISQAAKDIELYKTELQEAKLVRQQKEEYEELRVQIMQHQSRGQTVQQCGELEEDIKALEAESLRLDALADKRRKQFALLHHCFEDLVENDNDEDVTNEVDELGSRADPADMEVD